ncbi:MAG TPA: phage holin family protein [Polyangia bacterium]|jgi:uncharacterized membrane protein YqjE|nr:phage holin family protein [Polyangia bacterium]
MSEVRFKAENEGLLGLVRETMDGIGRLISEHMKLARLEFQADIKTYGRSLAVLLLVAAVFVLAYGLACIGLAVLLSRWMPLAYSFFAVAGGHVLVGAIAAAVVVSKLRTSQPLMRDSVNEVQRSVGALTGARSGNGITSGDRVLAGGESTAQTSGGGTTWPNSRT